MSAERPSDHPNGYWMATTPSSLPAHAVPDWLMDLFGQTVGPNDAGALPEAPPIWPEPTGEGLPAWQRGSGVYETQRAPPASIADMVTPLPTQLAQAEWERNIKHGTNPDGPYRQRPHPQPNVEYEEVPRQPTEGIEPFDWSHTTRDPSNPGNSRYWRPKTRPMS